MDKQLRALASDLGHGRTASEIVADAIRHMIAAGTIKAGDRLPPERELAPSLGAARVTVRAAIKALNEEGLLVTGRGRSAGTIVANRPAQRASAVAFKKALAEAYEFRRIVEPVAAEMAAERGSASERRALLRLCREAEGDEASFQDADARFHRLIAKMTGNSHILDAVERNRSSFVILVNSLLLKIDSRGGPTFAAEHAPIAEAISRGDGAAARREMAAHFRRAHRQFLEALSHASTVHVGRNSRAGLKNR